MGRDFYKYQRSEVSVAFLVLVRWHSKDAPGIHQSAGAFLQGQCTCALGQAARRELHRHGPSWLRVYSSCWTTPRSSYKRSSRQHSTSCTQWAHQRRALASRREESHAADSLGRWLPAEEERARTVSQRHTSGSVFPGPWDRVKVTGE